MWHFLKGDTLKGPAWPWESYNLWFWQWFGKCEHPEAQFDPWNKEERRRRKPWDPSKEWSAHGRGRIAWAAFKPHNRDRSSPSHALLAQCAWATRWRVKQQHTSLHFRRLRSVIKVLVELVSLRSLHLAYGCSPSCCLFAWGPTCLGASLNHKATNYSGIACTYYLTLT